MYLRLLLPLLCSLSLSPLLPAPLAAQEPAVPAPTPPRDAAAQRRLDEQLVLLCFRRGEASAVEELLRLGADPNACVQLGELDFPTSAVQLAAELGYGAILRVLLRHGANPKLPGITPEATPLLYAVQSRNYLCTKMLLEAREWTPAELSYPFKMAVGQHCEPLAELILRHGADPNCPLFDGTSALLAAYQAPRGLASLRYLLRCGLKLSEPSPGLVFDAMGLALFGEEGCLELLLESGFDPNACNVDGNTLLSAVTEAGRKDKVALLLAHGADPRRPDSFGRYPADKAPAGSGIADMLREQAARLNAEGRALPAPPPELDFSPLMRAALDGDEATARRLLAEGADVNEAQAETGNSPLLLAVYARQEGMVRLLLAHGADIWQRNQRYAEPISQAIAQEGILGDSRLSELLWPRDLHHLSEAQADTLLTACASSGATARLQQLREAGIIDWQSFACANVLVYATLCGENGVVSMLLEEGVNPFTISQFGMYRAWDYTHCRPDIRQLFEQWQAQQQD